MDRSLDILQVFSHYRTHHPKACPDPKSTMKEWRQIRDRLKEGYSVADLCAAIEGCHRSPYHCGENPGGTVFDSLELIVRDSKHVTQFMEMPIHPPVLSEIERRNLRAGEDFLARTDV